jgi:iron complex transport system ATP-binding protein
VDPATGPILELRRVRCAYGSTEVLHCDRLALAHREFVGVLGRNGAGKTTLLKTMGRLLRPARGSVVFRGRDLYATMSASEAARSIAAVAQDSPLTFEFTCGELVLMGRAPHVPRFGRESAEDERIARESMARIGVTAFRDRLVTEVSGGERQRVLIARALAQSPELLLLDEPTAHLDARHRRKVLALLRGLRCTVVAVMHEVEQALAACDRLLVLDRGAVVADGTPAALLAAGSLADLLGEGPGDADDGYESDAADPAHPRADGQSG